MKATESPLVNLLKGPRQFLIPIYQRAYSWTEDQCAQLWEDVLRVAENDDFPAHFIGSVVYIEHGLYQATAIPQLLVIDGQQRLTTFTLMVEALSRALDDEKPGSGEITARKLRNYFLLNPEEDGALRYKLQLSQGDRSTLWAILDGKALPKAASSAVVDNFAYFQDRLAESEISPEALYGGLSKLIVVDVALDRDHDNPQLIFESLNSTGLDLSQSDLIRNFVLMGLEPTEQEELYRDHWRPIEEVLAKADRPGAFDRFLRAWLTMRLAEVPKLDRGYETFKNYRMLRHDQPIRELVADLHRCAEHYGAIALGLEEHEELAGVFAGLRALRIDAPMPFLLHAYGLWKDGTVSEQDTVQIARLMESWLFRRAVCDIPSNVLSRTFATIADHLDEEKLLESLSAWLVLRVGRQRFPKDDEFRAALTTRNMYEFKHRQYCLARLENDGRKEPVDIGEYTIEHVLPQNESVSPEWQEMLGPNWREVQERWLHTLGNLTLTGYNPELSDRPFARKLEMAGGFRDSPLRLNRSIAKVTDWNEEAIEARGKALADQAMSLWCGPHVEDEVLASYRTSSTAKSKRRPLDDATHFGMTDDTLELFEALRSAAHEIGFETTTIWKSWIGIGRPGAGKPYPVILRPRKGWLLVDLRVPFEKIENPPSFARARPKRDGAVHTRVEVHSLDDVQTCCVLLAGPGGFGKLESDDDGEEEDDD